MAFQMRGADGPADQRRPPESRLAGAKTVLSERWVDQVRFTLRLERGFVLQQRGALLAPSARPAGLDDIDGGPDCRVYIQMCCIEQVRIRRASQGRRCAVFVAFITLKDVCQHRRFIDIPPLRPIFGRAAAGAHLRPGSHENLNVGIGADDGANVPSIENRSWWRSGKLALERK